jgi:uncharacterized integral membrane protein
MARSHDEIRMRTSEGAWEAPISIVVFILTLVMIAINLSDVVPALYRWKMIRKTDKSLLVVRGTLLACLSLVAVLAWDWGDLRGVLSHAMFDVLDDVARAFL